MTEPKFTAPSPPELAAPKPPELAAPGAVGQGQGLRFSGTDAVLNDAAFQVFCWDSSRFVLDRKLEDASRNQGVVNLMQDKKNGSDKVAVKRMPLEWVQADHASFCKRHSASASERPWYDIAIANFLTKEGSSFACRLYGVFADSTSLYVVSSFASGGDLFDWCKGHGRRLPGKSREALIWPIAKHLFMALQALHDYGICHRDISLENALVHNEADGSICVKLIDYGMASVGREHSCEVRGKYSYQAPEMHRGSRTYDGFLSDAFAAGVVLFCLGVNEYPWNSTEPGKCKKFIFAEQSGLTALLKTCASGKRGHETLVDILSPSFVSLQLGLLEFRPAHRLTLGEGALAERRSVWSSQWLSPDGRLTLDEAEAPSYAAPGSGDDDAPVWSPPSSPSCGFLRSRV